MLREVIAHPTVARLAWQMMGRLPWPDAVRAATDPAECYERGYVAGLEAAGAAGRQRVADRQLRGQLAEHHIALHQLVREIADYRADPSPSNALTLDMVVAVAERVLATS
jgi:hypothetical protein